jgi:hypothetical protein
VEKVVGNLGMVVAVEMRMHGNREDIEVVQVKFKRKTVEICRYSGHCRSFVSMYVTYILHY